MFGSRPLVRPEGFAQHSADSTAERRLAVLPLVRCSLATANAERPSSVAAVKESSPGRRSYRRFGLGTNPAMAWGDDTVVFPWLGDRVLDTLAVWLTTAVFQTGRDGVALMVSHCTPTYLGRAVWEVLAHEVPSGLDLASEVPNMTVEKLRHIPRRCFANLAYACGHLDVARAAEVLTEIQDLLPSPDVDPVVGLVPESAGAVSGMPFAVVDVETTGFEARCRDRIVEIAIVRLAPDGTVLGEWSSLVNPERGPGATSVHALRGEDLLGAPRFANIATWWPRSWMARCSSGTTCRSIRVSSKSGQVKADLAGWCASAPAVQAGVQSLCCSPVIPWLPGPGQC